MFAYTVSRNELIGKRGISFYVVFTTLFGGGLVPYYILMTQWLHLQNTYAILILPQLGSVWYIFLLRTNFQDIPASLIESAIIDGAGHIRIFFSLILPLSTPVLATVAMFSVLGYWNEWFNAMLFITKDSLIPLQYLLQRILRLSEFLTSNMSKIPKNLISTTDMPKDSLKMTMVVVAAGPMLVAFPFFQKYFVRGITLGSVKG